MLLREMFEASQDGDSYFDMTMPEVRDLWDERNRSTLVYMTPDEYLRMALPGFEQGKADRVNAAIEKGVKFTQLPCLLFQHDGRGTAYVQGHEGRHRARALKSRGVTRMPVVIRDLGGPPGTKSIRWGIRKQPGYNHIDVMPETLVSENGTQRMPMPVSAIFP